MVIMFWLSAYTNIRCVSRIIMRFKLKLNKKSNDVLSFMFSKIRALVIEFCYGKICNFKSASR